MLIDRRHGTWAISTVVAGGVALGAYLADPQAQSASGRHGGWTWVGLGLGIAALAIMLFCAALSLKRRVPHWRLGRAQTWLRGHIWLGLLTVWLVALHGAFRAGGPLTTWLWIVLGLVTISALIGVGIQQVVPRLLLHGVPGETLAQQLDRQLAWVTESIEKTVCTYAGSLDTPAPPWSPGAAAAPEAPAPSEGASAEGAVATATAPPAAKAVNPNAPPAGGEPLRRCYVEYVRPFLERSTAKPLASRARSESIFVAIKTMTPAHIHPGVDDLEALCERRRQLARQKRLMWALHAWLIVHVPLSWGLLGMSIIHAIWALRFLPGGGAGVAGGEG